MLTYSKHRYGGGSACIGGNTGVREGDKVTFQITRDHRTQRTRAVNIVVIEKKKLLLATGVIAMLKGEFHHQYDVDVSALFCQHSLVASSMIQLQSPYLMHNHCCTPLHRNLHMFSLKSQECSGLCCFDRC